ncbi:MAG TPA: hypothetical protein VEY71_06210 [Chitinophagales bacterium]|nr:hypothetical protein [Chitinophagales bacterium]
MAKKHGPSNHERGRNALTTRNWRQNLIALAIVLVIVLFLFMTMLRGVL